MQSGVFETTSPADLVRNMIEQQLSVSVATAQRRPYVVQLVRMIELAASGE